jgi:hypothetical protein
MSSKPRSEAPLHPAREESGKVSALFTESENYCAVSTNCC